MRRRGGGGGPCEGLGELGGAAAGEGEGFEGGGRAVEKFQGFSDYVFACETRSSKDYNVEFSRF